MILERLEWGGIRADVEGTQALAHALDVIRWLAADYAAEPVDNRRERVLDALAVVDEVILCAIGREREEREESERERACDS